MSIIWYTIPTASTDNCPNCSLCPQIFLNGVHFIETQRRYVMAAKICICLLVLVSVGCTRRPMCTITSSSPAYIEVGGEIVCQNTPCSTGLPYYKNGFGECVDGDNVVIAAFPIDKSHGFVQQKMVRSYCGEKKKVFFDMEATGGIQTFPPMRGN